MIRGSKLGWAVNALAYLVLALFTFAVVFPLLAVVFDSLKSQNEFFTNPWGWPLQPDLSNYSYAWGEAHIPLFMLNSTIVAGATTLFTLALSATAGYAFSRFRFRGGRALFFMFVVLLIVPAPVSIIPLYVIIANLHLMDTYFALILPYTAGGLPLGIYLLRAFFSAIPRELIDAARMDGCTEVSAFWRIVIPISRGGLATVAILSFVGAWNEFFLALLFIHNSNLLTLPLGLQTFFFQYHVQWPYYFAGLSTAIIPIIVVYLVLQRQFISGLTAGAVRG
ncbi:MAG: carbohydrate ABC transporter permease [Verrucomicrobia bacterium]|nr:carbohydrate ABC transporter permease [Verrucomicrobiota bacterium]MBV9674392.1 carbohydrate ABC transporter permease [Verrucomicrobiota bacterium]